MYLDIMFDPNMRLNEHLKTITIRLRFHNFFYKFEHLGLETLMCLYYAFVHNIAKYVIIASGGVYNNSIGFLIINLPSFQKSLKAN